MVTKEELLTKGGPWLAAVRRWIQWNAVNGSRVIWSSDNVPRFQKKPTVRDFEELAAEIAVEILNEAKS